jgi:dihydropteroate synthase
MRRVITREQGRALEAIGHAVDYLNDCNLHQGDDAEFLNVAGPSVAAIQILIAARQRIFQSLPLVDTWHRRMLNMLLRRKPRLQSGPVIT